MKVLLFCLLKIVEISTIVFVPYFMGKYIKAKPGEMWIVGLGAIVVCLGVTGILFILCKLNWDWAGMILGR